MQPVNDENPAFELGTWVGRRQAFGLIANKCSAADAECLKQLRASKRYKTVAASWEEFCGRYLSLSRAHADKIIQQLEEFGSAYFELSQIVRIPEQAYRAISSAVADDSIEYKGEKIPITRENAAKIAEVVALLRRDSDQYSPSMRRAPLKSASTVRKRLEACFADLAALGESADAAALIKYGLETLGRLSNAL